MTRGKRLFEKNAVSGGTGVITIPAVIGNSAPGVPMVSIPAGYIVEMIVFLHTGTADATIDLGYTAGANDIVDDLAIPNSNNTVYPLHWGVGSTLAGYNIYISSASWVNVSLAVYVLLRKVK